MGGPWDLQRGCHVIVTPCSGQVPEPAPLQLGKWELGYGCLMECTDHPSASIRLRDTGSILLGQ